MLIWFQQYPMNDYEIKRNYRSKSDESLVGPFREYGWPHNRISNKKNCLEKIEEKHKQMMARMKAKETPRWAVDCFNQCVWDCVTICYIYAVAMDLCLYIHVPLCFYNIWPVVAYKRQWGWWRGSSLSLDWTSFGKTTASFGSRRHPDFSSSNPLLSMYTSF